MRSGAPLRASLAALVVLLSTPGTARAFTEYTNVTPDCHERITLEALARAGWPDGFAPPEPTPAEALVAQDLPFPLARERRDPWTIALLFGVRHPDLRDLDPADLPALAMVAAERKRQAMHCLRSTEDDGPEGDRAALEACRAYVRRQVEVAIGGGDAIEPRAQEARDVWLSFRGDVGIRVSRFAFRMGLALHALQDSFSHAFRDPETAAVRHVLNYVDYVGGDHREARDGHGHMTRLDQCDRDDPTRARRVAWAEEASADLLAAVADPAGGRAGRLARVDAVLDRWLAWTPGCTFENDYCDAPERFEPGMGCATSEWGGAGDVALFALVVVALARARRPARGAAIGLVGIALSAATPARADVASDVRALEKRPGVTVLEVDPERHEVVVLEETRYELTGGRPIERGVGIALAVLGGLDEAIAGGALGMRLDFVPWLLFGIDFEWNAWFSLSTGEAARGVANATVSAIFVYAKVRTIELRGRIAGGASILLFDLVAAERGSVGPFAGLAPLGVAIRAGRYTRVVLEPGGVFVAAPQMRGIPLVHRDHRFTMGLEITP